MLGFAFNFDAVPIVPTRFDGNKGAQSYRENWGFIFLFLRT